MAKVQIDISGGEEVQRTFRELALQFGRLRALMRERRAYLNMLRLTRRNRKDKTRKWFLARINVKVCSMKCENPDADIRAVYRMTKTGKPIVFVETVYAKGNTDPTTAHLRTLVLGPCIHTKHT